MHISDDAERASQSHSSSSALRPAAQPLSDAAILEIALQVRHAVSRPPLEDLTTWILSAGAALDPPDEERVIAALDSPSAPAWELAS